MFNQTLTAEQRLDKAVVDIMANPKYVALAGVLMIGKRGIEDDPKRCPTAYTNGKDERYGRAFVDKLNDAELRFLVLHEVYHKLYRHLTTWAWMWREHPQMANAACDYVINLEIVTRDPTGTVVAMPQKDGKPVVDTQNDTIEEAELVKTAHLFITDYRAGKVMHEGEDVGEVVESIVLTSDLQKALGIDLKKVGWLIGMKINDETIWKQAKAGEFNSFSVGGVARRVSDGE
jgi:hypothetical protein